MKKVVALAAFAAIAAAATASYAGLQARSGVNGSLHDMNFYANPGGAIEGSLAGTGSKQDVYNRVCVFCHTPHNAQVNETNVVADKLPLWGRLIDGTNQSQHAYQWATPMNSTLTIDDPLIGPSRLCLSCHDGSIGVDAHTSNGGSTSPNGFKLTGSRAIGSGSSPLETTHPIGFDYVAAAATRNLPGTDTNGVVKLNAVKEIVEPDQEFATAVDYTTFDSDGYNTVTRNSNRTISSVLYKNQWFTCASCHEVHNKENAAQEAGPTGKTPNYFLYAKEKESLICLSCHIK